MSIVSSSETTLLSKIHNIYPFGVAPVNDSDERIAAHYDDLADHWAEIVTTSERSNSLWSVLEAMLPDIRGSHALDAGCGAGVFSERLADRGAEVTGVDISERMLVRARERVPEATFHRADITGGLERLPDDSVDVVLCQHVFSHLPDLTDPLATFRRVLTDSGTLVVSAHNPAHYYTLVRDGTYPGGGEQAHLDPEVHAPAGGVRYAETQRFDITWGDDAVANRGTYYRRPIDGLFGPILDAGFTVDRVVEPPWNGDPGVDGDSGPDTDSGPDMDGDGRAADFPPEAICLRATL